jgi:cytochrome c oxidase assembly protein subunit 15
LKGKREKGKGKRDKGQEVWYWSIAAMTFAVLVVGGITRLTHSGLSMVEWQPLVGIVPPLTDAQWIDTFDRYRQFPEYQQLRQGMTLAEFKFIFFWEYLHRVLARSIGLVFLLPFVFFWLSGRFSRPQLARTLALFGLGAAQGVMGWLMVKSGLVDRPSVSHYRLAAHLSLAFLIFGASIWLARDSAAGSVRTAVTAGTRRLMQRGLAIVGALLAVQIVWGALVAGLKAGLIYNTFPLMAGRLVPPDLLVLSPAPFNFVQNMVTVQWTHRVLGTILLVTALVVFVRVGRSGLDQRSRRLNAALAILIVSQYLLGVLALVSAVPVALGVLHQAMAMAIAGVWVVWAHHVRQLAVTRTETVDVTRRVFVSAIGSAGDLASR